MTLEEIKAQLDSPELDMHQKQILKDLMLIMSIQKVQTSDLVDKQILQTIIQKERIS